MATTDRIATAAAHRHLTTAAAAAAEVATLGHDPALAPMVSD